MPKKLRANRIIFKIDGFTPDTLPSARLAQYLIDLNALLGSTTKVHFEKLSKGSAQIVQWAEVSAIPNIRQRALSAGANQDKREPKLAEAYEKLNRHLIEDNAAGTLRIGRENILDFPGSRTQEQGIIGPIAQNEYLDGQLVRIGGIDATIPVHLREGETFHYCTANVEVAKRLAPYLYGQTIRVFGMAHWYRFPQGQWQLRLFRVENFEPLDDASLHEAVGRVRAAAHDDWDETAARKIHLREGE